MSIYLACAKGLVISIREMVDVVILFAICQSLASENILAQLNRFGRTTIRSHPEGRDEGGLFVDRLSGWTLVTSAKKWGVSIKEVYELTKPLAAMGFEVPNAERLCVTRS